MAEKKKRARRKYRRVFLGLFLGMVTLTMALHLVLPDREFSKVENRTLKQAPHLTMASIKDGSFMKDLTGYLEDQFPGRDQFIRLKAQMERVLFRMENNDVYIRSRENLIDKFTPNNDALTREKAAVLNAFAKEHSGLKLSVMLVPTKSEILKSELPPYAPENSQKEYQDKFYGLLSQRINAVDLLPSFTDNSEDYLFFRSDHHWTQEGAFLAQEAYLKSMKLDPRKPDEYEISKVASDFLGSLTSKSGITPARADEVNLYLPNLAEDIVVNLTEEQQKLTSFYQLDSLEGQDKYLVFLGGNYPVVRISTASPADRRLLIIKDSYANAFVPFMTRDFNEITMVDLRYFTGDINQLVQDYLITDALVLYNINTFNDDNSILNIGDTLLETIEVPEEPSGEGPYDEPGEDTPEQEPPLEAEARPNPHIDGQYYLRLKNPSSKPVTYQRMPTLEKRVDDEWIPIQAQPGFTFDETERTLGASANAEYLIDLDAAFGFLEEGRYRLVQSYDGDETASADFQFAGSIE